MKHPITEGFFLLPKIDISVLDIMVPAEME